MENSKEELEQKREGIGSVDFTKLQLDCPKGCKGLTYQHDDHETRSCCDCSHVWNMVDDNISQQTNSSTPKEETDGEEFIKYLESEKERARQCYELFAHLSNEHGLILLESQLQEIIRIVQSQQTNSSALQSKQLLEEYFEAFMKEENQRTAYEFYKFLSANANKAI